MNDFNYEELMEEMAKEANRPDAGRSDRQPGELSGLEIPTQETKEEQT